MSTTGTNEVGSGRWTADLRTTTHGVVHVRAEDWGGLGLGQGWACIAQPSPVSRPHSCCTNCCL